MQMLQFLLLSLSKKDVVMDKVPKQHTTHIGAHTQSNQASMTTQALTENTLLRLGKRHLTSTGTGQKMVVYWWLLASSKSG
jgi:hypothetical protein